MFAKYVTTAAGARVSDPRLSPLRQAALAGERRYKKSRHYILQLSIVEIGSGPQEARTHGRNKDQRPARAGRLRKAVERSAQSYPTSCRTEIPKRAGDESDLVERHMRVLREDIDKPGIRFMDRESGGFRARPPTQALQLLDDSHQPLHRRERTDHVLTQPDI